MNSTLDYEVIFDMDGVIVAKAAGMTCLGFTGLEDNDEDLSEADFTIKDLTWLSRQISASKKLSGIYS